MKLIIPIAGTLAVCACTVWVLAAHTVRRKAVIYQPSEDQNKTSIIMPAVQWAPIVCTN